MMVEMTDLTRIVGIQKKDCKKFDKRQYPLIIDDNLVLIVQANSVLTFLSDKQEIPRKVMDAFQKKYDSYSSIEELVESCSVLHSVLVENLQQTIPCVGCRRGVEEFLHQAQQFEHPLYECLKIDVNGNLSLSKAFLKERGVNGLRTLFHSIRPKLQEILDGVINGKKNKRCIFHSLKMMKPNEYHPIDHKYSAQKSFGASVIDVWDQMCQECHKEITRLECTGILETMDYYLKKHRFCSECKSKVQRAYHMLTGDVDHQNEPGFCSAIFEGLKFCKNTAGDGTGKEKDKEISGGGGGKNAAGKHPNHVHVCCERGYVVHMLTLADAEITGGRKERHAKTIDIAQEEVCTCLSLYLYYRLHKVWHTKQTFEQTWFTLLSLSLELIFQNFEMSIEKKFGLGRMEAFCSELEKEAEMKNLKIEKKRLKRKNKQKKKKEQKGDVKTLSEVGDQECSGDHNCQISEHRENSSFSFSLLRMLNDGKHCTHGDQCPDVELELTNDEILEFEKNRQEIDAQRTKLRDKLKQNFNDYVVASGQRYKDA